MRPVTANQEIIQVALMRGCWFAAEAIFAERIRAICRDWTEGDTKEANRLLSCFLRGDSRKVPAELAFAVSPLVDMLQCLRERCEPVDAALRMAISADPAASGKGVLGEVPEGYISMDEATRLLGQAPHHLRYSGPQEGVRILAYARAISVVGNHHGRGRGLRYFLRQDIETVRHLLDDHMAERTARHIRHVARIQPKAPPDAISIYEVARRLGRSVGSVRDAIKLRPWTLPPMHKIGARWFAYESDLRDFPAEPERRRLAVEKINQLKAQGYLQTRESAQRVGLSQHGFINWTRSEGIQPERIDHVALYAPADLDRLITLVSARHNERTQQSMARKAAKMAEQLARPMVKMAREAARAAAREKRDKLLAIHAAAVAARRMPIGAIPHKDVLATIGMTALRFDKIRRGLSSTPIPRYRKAGNGQLYCTPDDLAAFLADPQNNRMVVVADTEYQQREHERKVRDKRYAKVKRRYGNAVHREAWM
jgi:hypothetical protein